MPNILDAVPLMQLSIEKLTGAQGEEAPEAKSEFLTEKIFVSFRDELFDFMRAAIEIRQKLDGVNTKIDIISQRDARRSGTLIPVPSNDNDEVDESKEDKSKGGGFSFLGLLGTVVAIRKAIAIVVGTLAFFLKSLISMGKLAIGALRVLASALNPLKFAAAVKALSALKAATKAALVVAAGAIKKVPGASAAGKALSKAAAAASSIIRVKPAGGIRRGPGARFGSPNKVKSKLMRSIAKRMVKSASGRIALKALPVGFGVLFAAVFAGGRLLAGDTKGAAAELAIGGAAFVPGVGTAVALTASVALLARDVYGETYGTSYEDDVLSKNPGTRQLANKRFAEIGSVLTSELKAVFATKQLTEVETQALIKKLHDGKGLTLKERADKRKLSAESLEPVIDRRKRFLAAKKLGLVMQGETPAEFFERTDGVPTPADSGVLSPRTKDIRGKILETPIGTSANQNDIVIIPFITTHTRTHVVAGG